jgi:hypothetical protein
MEVVRLDDLQFQQLLAKQRILPNRKAMAVRQRKEEVVAVEELQETVTGLG